MHITSSLRRVLLLATVAVAIIVGLLGMHTFSDESAGHGSGLSAMTAQGDPDAAVHVAVAIAQHPSSPAFFIVLSISRT